MISLLLQKGKNREGLTEGNALFNRYLSNDRIGEGVKRSKIPRVKNENISIIKSILLKRN